MTPGVATDPITAVLYNPGDPMHRRLYEAGFRPLQIVSNVGILLKHVSWIAATSPAYLSGKLQRDDFTIWYMPFTR